MTLHELTDWLRERSRLTRVRAVFAGAPPADAVRATARRLGVAIRVVAGGDPADAVPLDAGAALDVGRRVANEEADSGTDLLVVAGVEASARVPAAVLVAALADLEPIAVVRDHDDARWTTNVAAVRDGLRRARSAGADPTRIRAAVGRGDLAVLAGLLEHAAVRRTPVLIDGLVAGAAALAAQRNSTDATAWWLAAHDDGEPALQAVWSTLRLSPPLLSLRAQPGLGALLAVPLLQAALDLG